MKNKILGIIVIVLILAFKTSYAHEQKDCSTSSLIIGAVTCEVQSGIEIKVYKIMPGWRWVYDSTIFTDINGCYSADNLTSGQQYGIVPVKNSREWHFDPESDHFTKE